MIGVCKSHIVAHPGLLTAVREDASDAYCVSATLLNFPPQYCGDRS
jgi:hypothetical protein